MFEVIKNKKMTHTEHLDRRKTRFISLLSFLIGITEASLLYVLSSYFAEVLKSDNVGMFYLVSYGASLIMLFFLRPLVRRMGRIRTFLLSLVALVFVSVALSKLPISLVGAMLLVFFLFLANITWVTLDIILEAYSADKVSGRIRGLHLTIMNIGILCGPLISTRTLDHFGFEGIFFILVAGFTLILILSLLFLRKEPDTGLASLDLKPFAVIRKMLQEKDLARIYAVSFSLEFFFVAMTIYMPIYLLSIGMLWADIGKVFTIMLIPFVILQYPLGWIADKFTGEKEFLLAGIFLSGTSTLLVAFVATPSVAIWAGLLFLTRIGAATIEVLRDAYFYKQIDGNDLDIISFFRTARPMANILAALILVPLLLFFPLPIVFIVVASVFFLVFFFSLPLTDDVAERTI